MGKKIKQLIAAKSLNINIDHAIGICFGHTDMTFEQQVCLCLCNVLQYDVKGCPIGPHWVKEGT